jgi:hypothetical protein
VTQITSTRRLRLRDRRTWSLTNTHSTRQEDDTADAADDTLASSLRAAPTETYPRIAALAGELLAGTAAARERWFVDVLLAGANSTPRP